MEPQRPADENPLIPFLRSGQAPDRTRFEGWQRFRAMRTTPIVAPRKTWQEFRAMTPRSRALHNMLRTSTHVNLRIQESPMNARVTEAIKSRLENNAFNFRAGTRDGLMISGGGSLGKTETLAGAGAEFEDLWRGVLADLLPEKVPGTRDVFAPLVFCRLPVKATPKGMARAILDFYGDAQPGTLDDLKLAIKDALHDHGTTALLIDDITRLRLHRESDDDTLDFIKELMDMNVTLVMTGVDIPHSGLLRDAHFDPKTSQWVFPRIKPGRSFNPTAAAHGDLRFDVIDLDPFDYTTGDGIAAFVNHLAGIEEQLRLFNAFDGMLTTGEMPEYLFRRTRGVVGLLARLIAAGCSEAIASGEERLTPELLARTPIRLAGFADLDPDAGEIPDIPRDVPTPKPDTKKGRGRNTSFDEHAAGLRAADG